MKVKRSMTGEKKQPEINLIRVQDIVEIISGKDIIGTSTMW